MKLEDFKTHGILDFTPKEIEITRSDVDDVDLRLMTCAQAMRDVLGRGMKPISFTGGVHEKRSYHYLGKAMDFVLTSSGPMDVISVVRAALEGGFKGIGVYWNGKAFSFHVDIRTVYGFWYAYKKPGESQWHYVPLSKLQSYLKAM